MDEHDWLAERFEEHRTHLRAVAYRMLGSLSEADDAVQEAWLRLSRSDTSGVENLGGWLTTVVARVCLDMLRSRKSRREEPLGARRARAGREPPGAEPTPSTRRCWPTRSVSRCWWCSRRWPPPSGSRSCCTTCSPCPSTRSRPSSGARRPRPGSSPAAPAAGCRERPRRPTPIWPASERWSMPSWPPRAAVTSTRCSRCSTRTWCCAPTPRRCGWRAGRGARRGGGGRHLLRPGPGRAGRRS